MSEFAITTANGRIYVLDDVLNPAIETIYERLSTKTDHKFSVRHWNGPDGGIH